MNGSVFCFSSHISIMASELSKFQQVSIFLQELLQRQKPECSVIQTKNAVQREKTVKTIA